MEKLLYKTRDKYIEILIGGIFIMLLLSAVELGLVFRVFLSLIIAIVIYFLFIKNKYRVGLDYQSLILENILETKVIPHKDIINIEKSIGGFTMKGYRLSELGYKIICKEQEEIREYNVLIGIDFLNDWKLIMSEINNSYEV